MRPRIVGTGRDVRTGEVRPVLDGADIFRLVDSEGVPMATVNTLCAQFGLSFDLHGFCQAAKQSGNFTADKLTLVLLDDVYDADTRVSVLWVIDTVMRR